MDQEPLLEWLCSHYTELGVKIDFITDSSSEGHQFVHGFGGIGGFLRFKVDLSSGDTPTSKDDGNDEDKDFM